MFAKKEYVCGMDMKKLQQQKNDHSIKGLTGLITGKSPAEIQKYELEMDNLRLENKRLRNEWWRTPLFIVIGFILGILSPIIVEWLYKKLGLK